MGSIPPSDRAQVDRDGFHQRVREQSNESVTGHGHHPFDGYTPAGFRHYTRRGALLAAMSELEFGSALDVGCSEGFFMEAIRSRFSVDVWGVDLSDEAVLSNHRRHGFPVAAADGLSLPFADGAFDLVYSTETIEHVLDPAAFIAEARRVARRWVVITTPVSLEVHPPDFELNDEGHINSFTPELVEMLFPAGSRVRTFRNNMTFGLVAGVGRHLPAPSRDWTYRLDTWFSRHAGRPTGPWPIRNRDWLVIAPGAAQVVGPREWRAPGTLDELMESDSALIARDGRRFPLIGPGIPDFVTAGR